MGLISRLRDHRYCAFCKARRKVYVKKHIDLTNVVGAVLLSFGVTYVIYGAADPQGLMLVGAILLVSESFVYLRWRLGIVCKMCGFDPVIYKRSPAQASALVSQFFREQVQNPEFWLTKSPLLQVQKRIREQE